MPGQMLLPLVILAAFPTPEWPLYKIRECIITSNHSFYTYDILMDVLDVPSQLILLGEGCVTVRAFKLAFKGTADLADQRGACKAESRLMIHYI